MQKPEKRFIIPVYTLSLFLLVCIYGLAEEKLTHTFRFQKPIVQKVQAGASSFTRIQSRGAVTQAQHAGEPALPMHCIRILLPPGKKVTGVRVEGEFHDQAIELPHPVFPHQPPIPTGQGRPEQLVIDEPLYRSHDRFPSEDHAWPDTGFSRGYSIFSMSLYPVKYVPGENKIYWNTELTVDLDLSETPVPFLRDKPSDQEWVEKLVCNPEAAGSYREEPARKNGYPGGLCDPSEKYDYVIITTTYNSLDNWATGGSIPYNWESLMDRHAAMSGLSCTLITIQEILATPEYENPDPLFNDTPARIREFCKDAYWDWGTDYLLIGGDDEWIPARHLYYHFEGEVDSDIYWNHLDGTFNNDHDSEWGEAGDGGFDPYAELFIGRITCDNPRDVSNWLTKLFYYMDSLDADYLDNAAFYGGDTGWSCEGDDFIDYSAIQGAAEWLGPNPWIDPYPSWIGFQYGFETWNQENPDAAFDLSVKWTEEPPNPGWSGPAGLVGLRAAINNDACTLISGMAHADAEMSLDVTSGDWENLYHNTRPFLIHDYGCHCGDMDGADDGVLHSMLFHSDSSLAFGCVFHTSYGWGNYDCTCSSSAFQQKCFWDYFFDIAENSGSCDTWQLGRAMAFARDFMAPTLNWDPDFQVWRCVIESCLLFSDPALKLKPPIQPALYLSFPSGRPQGMLPPGPARPVMLQILPGLESYQLGTGKLCYRFHPDDPYVEVPLVPLGNNLFEALIPPTCPTDEPQYFLSAEGTGGTARFLPCNAPDEVYGFEPGISWKWIVDDCEVNTGWSVQSVDLITGEWELADPEPTGAQPGDDHTPDGVMCWVTDGQGGGIAEYDVDGGPTRLITPIFDLEGGDAFLRFYLWFYHADTGIYNPMEIDINNGSQWVHMTHVYPQTGWTEFCLRVSDYVTPTDKVQVRFSVTDNPSNSVLEAAIDDFVVERITTSDTSLWADEYAVSVSTGCVIRFTLDAGTDHAGRIYLMLGSMTGTTPGHPLPGGGSMSLNWDLFTELVLLYLNTPVCENFLGMLDGSGSASATLNTFGPLDPAAIGLNVHYAFVLGNPFDFISNPIPMSFEP